MVAKQLPKMPRKNIILEPARRNTAPCITYAAYRIASKNSQAQMVVAPADHLITDEDEFARIVKLAAENSNGISKLFTLGIRPHRPDTGYGYIQYLDVEEDTTAEIKKVKTFTEKPDLETAKDFLDSGDFLWNSGIFIWSVSTFMEELQNYQPDLHSTFEAGAETFGTRKEQKFVEKIYPSCENVSIDYGLMEKSENVYVIPSQFGWSDLGTWGSLHEHVKLDENKNAILSKKSLISDTKNSLIRIKKDKLAIIEGLNGFIVVDEDDSLLICRMENEQLIKSYLGDAKTQFEDHAF